MYTLQTQKYTHIVTKNKDVDIICDTHNILLVHLSKLLPFIKIFMSIIIYSKFNIFMTNFISGSILLT